MPQGPNQTNVAVSEDGGVFTRVPLNVDADGALITSGAVTPAVNPSAAAASLNLDAAGNLRVSGGTTFVTNRTIAVAIKATAGRLRKIIILAPGSGSGSFSVNNCATTGAATAANLIWTRAFGDVKAGDVFDLDVPCDTGITLSAVPGAGSPICAFVFD